MLVRRDRERVRSARGQARLAGEWPVVIERSKIGIEPELRAAGGGVRFRYYEPENALARIDVHAVDERDLSPSVCVYENEGGNERRRCRREGRSKKAGNEGGNGEAHAVAEASTRSRCQQHQIFFFEQIDGGMDFAANDSRFTNLDSRFRHRYVDAGEPSE